MRAEVIKISEKQIDPLFQEIVAPKEMKVSPVGKLGYVVETYPIPSENVQEQGNITFVATFYNEPKLIERSRRDRTGGPATSLTLKSYGKLYIKCAGFSVGPYSQYVDKTTGKLTTNWQTRPGSGGFEIVKNDEGEFEVQAGDLRQHIHHQSWQISGKGSLHNYIMSFLRDGYESMMIEAKKDPERFAVIEAPKASTETIEEEDKQIMNQLSESTIEMPE